jgi:hypothetical protein
MANDSEKADIVREVRQPKTRLIELDGRLYAAGFKRESRTLGAIIARLEAFEARHGR